jgi:hypothetical protein
MDLFLVILQGVGVGLAAGISPFAAPLLAGALARGDLGLDFEGTGYGFLESIPFLVVMFALSVLWIYQSSSSRLSWPLSRYLPVIAVVALALGALEFAAALADEDYSAAAGIAPGALSALLGLLAARAFIGGAQARLESRQETATGTGLSVFADAGALLLAALAVAVPPISLVALFVCAWIVVQRRRRAAQKYEGLRVLR